MLDSLAVQQLSINHQYFLFIKVHQQINQKMFQATIPNFEHLLQIYIQIGAGFGSVSSIIKRYS